MLVSEIFSSIQGEGQFTGTPSVFVRLSGCNLRCWFCDTPYASWEPEGEDMTVAEIVSAASNWWHEHVVITGGEPMIFRQLPELTEAFRRQGRYITIETAGTVFQEVSADLMSISPKRANSKPVNDSKWQTIHEQRRHAPEAIRSFLEEYHCQFKFVIDTPADLEDVADYLEEIPEIDRSSVWLMPQSTTAEELNSKLPWLQQLALDQGFHLSNRLQIQQFGNQRGT